MQKVLQQVSVENSNTEIKLIPYKNVTLIHKSSTSTAILYQLNEKYEQFEIGEDLKQEQTKCIQRTHTSPRSLHI